MRAKLVHEGKSEFLDPKDLKKRRAELKKQGYYVHDSKVTKGAFTAQKEDDRIVVAPKK